MKLLWAAATLSSILISASCKSAPPPQAPSPTQTPSPPPSTPPPIVTAIYPSLTSQANQLGEALGRKDYAKVIDLTHPKVVEVGGGREKLLAAMTSEMKSMEAEGVTLLSSTASPASQFVSDASGIYAVVPVTTRIKAQGGIFQTEGSLIGVSTDGGQNWTFVDATGKDQTELKKVLPNFDKLNVPAEKPPVKVAEK